LPTRNVDRFDEVRSFPDGSLFLPVECPPRGSSALHGSPSPCASYSRFLDMCLDPRVGGLSTHLFGPSEQDASIDRCLAIYCFCDRGFHFFADPSRSMRVCECEVSWATLPLVFLSCAFKDVVLYLPKMERIIDAVNLALRVALHLLVFESFRGVYMRLPTLSSPARVFDRAILRGRARLRLSGSGLIVV